ncbi:hypothetical protein V1264_010238 [Littorina saxatilis]|uniref:Zinc finger PHD-type domain-containing protein n=1 Tax=Littorina saxatilis TaxID=31220 RepID=A0AAN9AP57_9CAEN
MDKRKAKEKLKYIEKLEPEPKARYIEKLKSLNGCDPYELGDKEWSVDAEKLPQLTFGDMLTYLVACDSENCKVQWYHTACVGLDHLPGKDDAWFCPACLDMSL